MRTLSDAAIEKQAQQFLDSLSYCQFKLDGKLMDNIPIYNKKRIENTIQVSIMIGYDCAGTITAVQIIDKDGLPVIVSGETVLKPESRGTYLTFRYKYLEKEASDIE